MASEINKKTLEYLAELSRIELDERSEEKLLNDLQNILGYFEELKGVDTERVEPMAGGFRLAEDSLRPVEGGTIENNVFREDEENPKSRTQSSKLTDDLPQKENDYLKVPPVFE